MRRDSKESYIYMERYVNKGSPSGYSFKYTTRKLYSPLNGGKGYPLPCFVFPIDDLLLYGKNPSVLEKLSIFGDVHFFIHPDVLKNLYKKYGREKVKKHKKNSINVSPTANGRTVLSTESNFPYFIKLHYDSILGRCRRELPYRKAISGVEISAIVERHLSQNGIEQVGILKEINSVNLIRIENHEVDMGFVIREFRVYPYISNKTLLIPFFALFSKDRFNPKDALLLTQILDKYKNPLEVLFDRIVCPVLVFYTTLVFDLGLIPEINAQNLLLELDFNLNPLRIVFRDFQGVEKDLTLREQLKLDNNFSSFPYKCISSINKEYFIRHSFSYDFKLGEYIFEELANFASKHYNCEVENFRHIIIERFRSLANGRESDYFPKGNEWYAHEKILLTDKRPYIKIPNPKYRRSK